MVFTFDWHQSRCNILLQDQDHFIKDLRRHEVVHTVTDGWFRAWFREMSKAIDITLGIVIHKAAMTLGAIRVPGF